MFCKHNWYLVDSQRIPSEAERVKLLGYKPNSWNKLKEKHVWIFKYLKCPKIKKIVKDNQ